MKGYLLRLAISRGGVLAGLDKRIGALTEPKLAQLRRHGRRKQ
jgi:hypothetical protein